MKKQGLADFGILNFGTIFGYDLNIGDKVK